ncbi:dehydrogenase/reductase SDR family member 13-like [Euwallacea similis]|uniref:dehydrogenase/reductase SDR family member 13-like n=1 Tax=Euwallacea similis TaxID=1736056 RepID=UPI00345084CD
MCIFQLSYVLDLIVKTSNSGIVNVSSICTKHLKRFGPLDVKNLNSVPKRITSYTTYSVHPGLINTKIFDTLSSFTRILGTILIFWLRKTPLEGTQTSIYYNVQKGIKLLSGEYFQDCRLQSRYESIQDLELLSYYWTSTHYLILTPYMHRVDGRIYGDVLFSFLVPLLNRYFALHVMKI